MLPVTPEALAKAKAEALVNIKANDWYANGKTPRPPEPEPKDERKPTS